MKFAKVIKSTYLYLFLDLYKVDSINFKELCFILFVIFKLCKAYVDIKEKQGVTATWHMYLHGSTSLSSIYFKILNNSEQRLNALCLHSLKSNILLPQQAACLFSLFILLVIFNSLTERYYIYFLYFRK